MNETTMPRAKAKRRYGGGSVTSYRYKVKAKNGRGTRTETRWRYQLRVPVDVEHPDGKTKLEGKSGYKTASEAQNGLDAAVKRLSEQQPVKAKKTTLSAFSDEWVNGLRLAPSTIAGYRKILRNHVVPQLGQVDLANLTATRINRHYTELLDHGRADTHADGRGLSPNTVNKVHNVLSAILDAALDDGYITVNPARKSTVKPPKSKEIRAAQSEVTTWTATELRDFLTWDRDDFQDDLYTLWLVISKTGMRRSEALALRWQDFDHINSRIAVRRAADTATARQVKNTKTGSSRVVDLPHDVVAALKSWKTLRARISFEFGKAGAYIFGNLDGELRSPNEVGRRWRYRVKAAQESMPDLPTVTLKGLRHTHATLLLQAGVQPKVVQERLGHSTIAITMNIYSHVMPSMQRDAVDRLSAIMGD
ncbi:tyrosine-type recombinase/integrase [uncultured Kocuria sp.]|uniref:tyrosine-type recombinase/integrase n=1 Tax=uncultured Kocuria sp. TaxID=259305 RepID=UPI0025957FB9|nr:tyrosine-type recombinase/integrase [uncultured Kocuria sp.]